MKLDELIGDHGQIVIVVLIFDGSPLWLWFFQPCEFMRGGSLQVFPHVRSHLWTLQFLANQPWLVNETWLWATFGHRDFHDGLASLFLPFLPSFPFAST